MIGDDAFLFDEVAPSAGGPSSERPIVRTPPGDIRLGLRYNGGIDVDPTDAYRIGSDGHLFVRRDGPIRAELLLVSPDLDLPHCMSVDGCVAAVWRVRAFERIASCEFSCRWASGTGRSEAGEPESGEGLDAQAWSRGRIRVSVGTEDTERLRARSAVGDRLPASWMDLLGYGEERYDPVRYVPDGFVLSLPALEPDAQCQIQFTVAWADRDPGDASTWFAVDCRWSQVLRALTSGRR